MQDDTDPAAAMSDGARRMALIAAFGARALDDGLALDTLLEDAAAHAAAGLGVKRAKVLQYRPETNDLLVRAGVGWRPGVIGHVALPNAISSPPGRAFTTGQAVAIGNIQTAKGFEWSAVLREHGVTALLNVPVRVPGGAVWGVLEADADAAPVRFNREHRHFLLSLAGVLGAVVRRFEMEEQRRRAEDEVRLANQRAEALSAERAAVLSQLADGVIVTDASGRITFVNEVAARLHGVAHLGVSPEEYSEAYHLYTEDGQPYPPAELPLARAVLRGETVIEERWRIRRPDGSEVLAAGSARPVLAPGGAAIGAVLTVRDETMRDAAERARRDSEARLRAVADNLPSGMVYQLTMRGDGSGRRFEYVSASCERLTGVMPEAALADPTALYEAIAVEDRPALAAAEEVAIQHRKPFDFEARLQGPSDVGPRWCRIVSAPREMPDGSLIWDGLLVDITERRLADAALREEAHTLEVLNRTGVLLLAELDLDRIVQAVTDAATELSGAAFGAFFYNTVNEQNETLTLYTISGVPREAFAKFPMPRSTAIFAPTFRGEGVIRSANIMMDPRYGLNAPHHGMPKGHLPLRSYLAVPVASRSGEVLGALFFGHPQADVFTDRSERIVCAIAAQAAIAIDNARLFQAAQREIAARTAAEAELKHLNETLEERVLERTRALEAEAGERRRAEEQLRQAQKMEAIGQLTGGLAHDVNNMLQGIGGALQMVERRLEAGRLADVPHLLKAGREGVDRAAALTHRLLAFARRGRLDVRPVVVDGLVAGMVDLVRRTVGPAIEVQLRLSDGSWAAQCDPSGLESALLNLAINARDAMPDGGRLSFATDQVRLAAADLGADAEEVVPGDFVLVSVADTGEGMPPDVMARVFEPFFTTKPIGKGTGLGLSQLYGFVRQSGGLVRLESVPGRGTTVCLYLPRAEGAAVTGVAPASPGAASADATGRTLLLVEDEPAVRALAAEALRERGYEVLEAVDGAAGLAALAGAARVDLLVTDVGLPGLNGRQLADAARERRPALPVLFITGYAGTALDGDLPPGMAAMAKPFSLDEFTARVSAMLAGAAVDQTAA